MNDSVYEQYVANVVRSMSFSDNAQVFTNKRYHGVRQPGSYEIDVSCEFWIDEALFFLIIVECKNWTRPIDRPQIQKLIQTRDAISAHKAAFASPVGYSKEAIEVAKANGVALWVVADGIRTVAAGGGAVALSIYFRVSEHLLTLLYKFIDYNFRYSHNLLDGHPNLIPFSWIWPDSNISLVTYPKYHATSPSYSSFDPIVPELFKHVLAIKPETNALTKIVNDAIRRIRQIFLRGGLNASQADYFLKEFIIGRIIENEESGGAGYQQLMEFDRSLPHSATYLQAPKKWLEKYARTFLIFIDDDNNNSPFSLSNNIIWANIAWLFHENEEILTRNTSEYGLY